MRPISRVPTASRCRPSSEYHCVYPQNLDSWRSPPDAPPGSVFLATRSDAGARNSRVEVGAPIRNRVGDQSMKVTLSIDSQVGDERLAHVRADYIVIIAI